MKCYFLSTLKSFCYLTHGANAIQHVFKTHVSPKHRAVTAVKTGLRPRHIDQFRRALTNSKFTRIAEV